MMVNMEGGKPTWEGLLYAYLKIITEVKSVEPVHVAGLISWLHTKRPRCEVKKSPGHCRVIIDDYTDGVPDAVSTGARMLTDWNTCMMSHTADVEEKAVLLKPRNQCHRFYFLMAQPAMERLVSLLSHIDRILED